MINEDLRHTLNEQDWPSVIKEVTLFAEYQLRCRQLVNNRGFKGYSADEIALEAIEKVFYGEWVWNPLKSSLTDYLKYHVVRGLIANLMKSAEKQTTASISATEADWVANEEEGFDEVEKQQIIGMIHDMIDDDEVRIVYNELLEGYKRKEICDRNGWQLKAYDNAMRRLGTLIDKVALKIRKDERFK